MTSIKPRGERGASGHRASRGGVWIRLVTLATACLLAAVAFSQSAAGQSILEPASRSAERIADLWWLMFWLGTVIFVIVMLLVLYAVSRGRRGEENTGLTNRSRHTMVLTGGVAVPLLVLAVVFGYTLYTLNGIAEDAEASDWSVEVIGHQFWWEVRYPDHDIVTANEIHIPVDRPVEFKLTSGDVIHSFWVPELHGKQDLMPGTTTHLTINAEETGRFRGQCGQFCGIQHAKMALYVVVDEPDAFDEWVDQQQEPASDPAEGSLIERGEEVFLSSACVYCHTVRNSNPSAGDLGPDLTHLASRETIAAGTLENTTGNLAGWIIDPQHIKPGNKMPAVNLTSEELQALLAYLNSLD